MENKPVIKCVVLVKRVSVLCHSEIQLIFHEIKLPLLQKYTKLYNYSTKIYSQSDFMTSYPVSPEKTAALQLACPLRRDPGIACPLAGFTHQQCIWKHCWARQRPRWSQLGRKPGSCTAFIPAASSWQSVSCGGAVRGEERRGVKSPQSYRELKKSNVRKKQYECKTTEH